MGIEVIRNLSIGEALDNNKRQYLTGNLSNPQDLKYIYDDDVEVGISHYKEFTCDVPHIHEKASEYQLMLSGYSELMDLETNQVTKLFGGDFFIIRNNTPYVQKFSKDSKVIFFKHPGLNDKELIDVSYEVEEWMRKEI